MKHCKNLNKVSVFRYVGLEVWVSGQVRSYIPRTEGQKKLLEFWNKYHLGGMSGGTIRQDEYLNGEQYVNDYNYFVELFKTYNEHYREQFDDISFQILVKNLTLVTRL